MRARVDSPAIYGDVVCRKYSIPTLFLLPVLLNIGVHIIKIYLLVVYYELPKGLTFKATLAIYNASIRNFKIKITLIATLLKGVWSREEVQVNLLKKPDCT